MDIDKLLNEATMPRRTVRLCLNGDLTTRYTELQAVVDAAVAAREQGKGHGSLEDGAHERAAREEMAALAEQMEPYTLPVTVEAVGRDEYRAIMAACPPRDGDDTDRLVGFDRERFARVLIRRCLVEPTLTDDQFGKLLKRLTDHQYETLQEASVAVNRRGVDVPFSPGASTSRRSSALG